MREFYETIRPLIRSTVQQNVSELNATGDAIAIALASRKLTGRRDALIAARTIALIRSGAWSSVAVNLHTMADTITRQGTSYLVTKLRTVLASNAMDYLEDPFLGWNLALWHKAAEVREADRVLKVLKLGSAMELTPTEAFAQFQPLNISNSSVGAMTITASTHIVNRLAMDAAKQAGVKEYKLWTDGKVKDPDIYNIKFAVGKGLLGPMFPGDRSIPIL